MLSYYAVPATMAGMHAMAATMAATMAGVRGAGCRRAAHHHITRAFPTGMARGGSKGSRMARGSWAAQKGPPPRDPCPEAVIQKVNDLQARRKHEAWARGMRRGHEA